MRPTEERPWEGRATSGDEGAWAGQGASRSGGAEPPFPRLAIQM